MCLSVYVSDSCESSSLGAVPPMTSLPELPSEMSVNQADPAAAPDALWAHSVQAACPASLRTAAAEVAFDCRTNGLQRTPAAISSDAHKISVVIGEVYEFAWSDLELSKPMDEGRVLCEEHGSPGRRLCG